MDETALAQIVVSLMCMVCLLSQCLEGMAVSPLISSRSFKLHKTSRDVCNW